MVCFPNAKINIGLNICDKRADGFHEIETVFYPIQLSDILEFNVSSKGKTSIKISGFDLMIPETENICYKAYQLINEEYPLPNLSMLLHKIIPSGAGLGGGSSDAAFLLNELNSFYKLEIPEQKLLQLASKLGSDCAFFIRNRPVFAYGRGELLEDIGLDLNNYYIYLITPDVFVSTADAYAGVKPEPPKESLKDLITKPIEHWKLTIENHFESSIFKKFPVLKDIKSELYSHGAVYASMSGSGSSVYGIFKELPKENRNFENYFNWISKM